jgi:hypothetical protein
MGDELKNMVEKLQPDGSNWVTYRDCMVLWNNPLLRGRAALSLMHQAWGRKERGGVHGPIFTLQSTIGHVIQ